MKLHHYHYTLFPIVVIIFTANFSSAFSLFSKLGLLTPKRAQISKVPIPSVALLVEIPVSAVQYDKPLHVKAGGRFLLETPMEQYSYSSAGQASLHRVQIAYLMQSMYQPNQFWSMKDPSVPWDTPRLFQTPRS